MEVKSPPKYLESLIDDMLSRYITISMQGKDLPIKKVELVLNNGDWEIKLIPDLSPISKEW